MKTILLSVALVLLGLITVQADNASTPGVVIDNPRPDTMYKLQITSNGNITGWTVYAQQQGTIMFTVTKNGTPISGGVMAQPHLTAQQNSAGTTTGWSSKSVITGDIIGFQPVAATTLKKVTITLQVSQ